MNYKPIRFVFFNRYPDGVWVVEVANANNATLHCWNLPLSNTNDTCFWFNNEMMNVKVTLVTENLSLGLLSVLSTRVLCL